MFQVLTSHLCWAAVGYALPLWPVAVGPAAGLPVSESLGLYPSSPASLHSTATGHDLKKCVRDRMNDSLKCQCQLCKIARPNIKRFYPENYLISSVELVYICLNPHRSHQINVTSLANRTRQPKKKSCCFLNMKPVTRVVIRLSLFTVQF